MECKLRYTLAGISETRFCYYMNYCYVEWQVSYTLQIPNVNYRDWTT